MKLTMMIKEGQSPNEGISRPFDGFEVVEASPDDNYTAIEEKMAAAGSMPFDPDDMFLYYPEVRYQGEMMESKRLNSGIMHDSGNIDFSGNKVTLWHACNLPYEGNSDVLILAPHFEEDFAMILSRLHKEAGDNVHIMFATPIRTGCIEESLRVYHDVLGLSEG